MPTTAPGGSQANAREAAAAMMKALEEAQRARAHGLSTPEQKARYDAALSAVWALTDAKGVHEIAKASRSPTLPRDVSEQAAVTIMTESWISLTAHYVDGIDLASMIVSPERPVDQARANVRVENPTERAKRERLEQELRENPPKDATGKPLDPHSTEYVGEFRRRALAEGFNVPTEGRIEIELTRGSEGWRVRGVSIQPAMGMFSATSQRNDTSNS